MSVFERVTDHTTDFDVLRGKEAEEILSGDVFYQAIGEAELNFLEIATYAETVEKRERARSAIIALTEVVKMLRKIQSEGEFAEEVVKQRAEMSQ